MWWWRNLIPGRNPMPYRKLLLHPDYINPTGVAVGLALIAVAWWL